MIDVAVVDYGMGNLRSVAKAIEHVAPRLGVAITSDPEDVGRASRVVLSFNPENYYWPRNGRYFEALD